MSQLTCRSVKLGRMVRTYHDEAIVRALYPGQSGFNEASWLVPNHPYRQYAHGETVQRWLGWRGLSLYRDEIRLQERGMKQKGKEDKKTRIKLELEQRNSENEKQFEWRR
ncbi:hypothetical protein CBL_09236 [Carabus blaptoides fortunei]